MKIKGTELNEKDHVFKAVRYIPNHANGNAAHKDCENGYISSWNDRFVFVKFRGDTSQGCNPENLMWGH